jgi:hypothetical protein
MTLKTFAIFNVCLVFVQGFLIILLGHGLNGEYFKRARSQGEALRNLRRDKPIVGGVIITCYALCLIEFGVVATYKYWGQ